jgi:hypothetical protein
LGYLPGLDSTAGNSGSGFSNNNIITPAIGYTGNKGEKRSPFACPEALIGGVYSIAVNGSFQASNKPIPALRGPCFIFPNRVAYIADGNHIIFDTLDMAAWNTKDSTSVNLRHGKNTAFNVIFGDMHGELRNKNTVTKGVVGTFPSSPFWGPGPNWYVGGRWIGAPLPD